MRHRPRLYPRNARPALCDTTSAAPARTRGTRPPDNPPSSIPDRTATNGRSRAEDTPGPRASVPASVLSRHLESRRQPAAPEPPRPEPSPTPAQPVWRRPRHRPPLTTLHGRATSEPPDLARGTPTTPTVAVGPGLATRPRTARSPEWPQDTSGAVTRHRRCRDRRNRPAAPGTPRPRTAPARYVQTRDRVSLAAEAGLIAHGADVLRRGGSPSLAVSRLRWPAGRRRISASSSTSPSRSLRSCSSASREGLLPLAGAAPVAQRVGGHVGRLERLGGLLQAALHFQPRRPRRARSGGWTANRTCAAPSLSPGAVRASTPRQGSARAVAAAVPA